MPDRKDDRQLGIDGSSEVTRSTDEFIRSTIMRLQEERGGLDGTIVDAVESPEIFAPTIDVGADSLHAGAVVVDEDPYRSTASSPVKLILVREQIRAASESGVSKRGIAELKARLKAA